MTSKKNCEDRLPGDLTKDEFIEQLIRVNQAGEYGAKRIYAGQMSVLKNDECFETLKHMADQEDEHLKYFNDEMLKRKVRPTILSPVWHVAGYLLGAGTAFMGKKAAMACTVAVEEVIDEHYQEQLDMLGDDEQDLKQKIADFRKEELEHRDIGLANEAESTSGYEILRDFVKLGSKLAIFLSKKY